MEWLGVIGAIGLALYLFARWRKRRAQTPDTPAVTAIGLNIASDRDLILSTFRRELANYLVGRDPDRFVQLYRRARTVETDVEEASKAVRQAHLTVLTNKYSFYQDFDLLGTREHILYADAFSINGLEEIEQHYLDLVQFHALQRALDPNWISRGPATSDENLKHLREYVGKIKDTRFQQRLVAAVDDFNTHRNDEHSDSGPTGAPLYETRVFDVHRVPHIAEVRFGFHFKDTDEFALYSLFHGDGKTYTTLYRSDASFESEIHLNTLDLDQAV